MEAESPARFLYKSYQKKPDVNYHNSMITEIISQILAILTIASHFFLIAGIILMLFKNSRRFILVVLGKNGILLSLSIAVASTVFSLFYSEIVGFEPCKLCWLQRIFIYPQVVLLGMAWFKKDFKIVDYALPLVIIGAIVAVYHNYIYYGGTSIFPCDALGLGVSCTRRYVFELGYITIPLMSLTGFLLMLFFLSAQKFYNKSEE